MRVAYPNIAAEEGDDAVARVTHRPVVRLIEAFTSLVDEPPDAWPWLARAHGLVPWLSTVEAERRAINRALPLWGTTPWLTESVHDKAFAARVARDKNLDDVAGLVVVLEPDEVSVGRVQAIADEWPRWAWASFTVKPRWGTSGRGRTPGVNGKVRLRPYTFALGAIVEPWLKRVQDLSSLWLVDEHGEPHLLGTTLMNVNGGGVYQGCTVSVTDVGLMAGTAHDDDVIDRARVVVEAAAARGYRGPCGVDAFTYRDPDAAHAGHDDVRAGVGAGERVLLRGVVELNARFTAGHVALGLMKRRAPKAGERFRFRLDVAHVDEMVARIDE